MTHFDRDPQFLKGQEVQVDGTSADRASAGQRDARAAFARHQRTEHEHGSAHGLDEVVRRFDRAQRSRLDLDGAADATGDVCAQGLEHAAQGDDVAHVGDVVQDDGLGRE